MITAKDAIDIVIRHDTQHKLYADIEKKIRGAATCGQMQIDYVVPDWAHYGDCVLFLMHHDFVVTSSCNDDHIYTRCGVMSKIRSSTKINISWSPKKT